MAKVRTLTPHPNRGSRAATTAATSKSRPWVPVAFAASLLIGVGGSSFWFFTRDSGNGTAARNPNRPPPATKQGGVRPRVGELAARRRLAAPLGANATGAER